MAAAFERVHKRPPTFWLDKVCIDQSNIADALRCLPVFEMACEKLLILCGQTYTTRLWCVWELYTFFAINANIHMVDLMFLDGSDNVRGLDAFDVADAHCFSAEDEARLRGAIEAGGAESFNSLVQDCGKQLLSTSTKS